MEYCKTIAQEEKCLKRGHAVPIGLGAIVLGEKVEKVPPQKIILY